MDINGTVENYINQNDWRIKENSNMGYSLQGLNNHISQIAISDYWLNKTYPKEISEHHKKGDYHIHDLGTLGTYCNGWDISDLLLNGFGGVKQKIETRPPKRLRVALGQSVNFLYTLQGESAGAQAFSNFDTYLAPFIYYDNLSYSEVKQCLQEFVYSMNVPTRVGHQCPFTNITMDLTCPNNLKSVPAIYGGKKQERTLGQFQREMDLFNKAFIEVMMEGDKKGTIFSFPIPTYNITKEFDWNNPVIEKLWELTTKYGLPYFANYINSDLSPEDTLSMCCRLKIDKRELLKRGGGLFGANALTGSTGVVTINLPRLAYKSINKELFFEGLTELMDSAKESLEIKRKELENYCEQGLYPYSKFYLRKTFEQTGTYWGNHFSTIGLIGMDECIQMMIRKGILSKEGKELAKQILDFMRKKISDYQEETKNFYNLEATPAEGASYRLALLDKKEFPKCLCANEKQYCVGKEVSPYYTNSSQVPVQCSEDLFEVLDNQDELQSKYTGGTVLHIFVGEKKPNPEATKQLIKTIANNYHLPYFTITPTFSICENHGYLSGEHKVCPECEKECEVYSRIVGYYRPVKNWNLGKQEEFKNRALFDLEKQNI